MNKFQLLVLKALYCILYFLIYPEAASKDSFVTSTKSAQAVLTMLAKEIGDN